MLYEINILSIIDNVKNYRPISFTSLVMKVYECCIQRELFSVCEQLLDPRQHGFVNNRSCTTQMIPFMNDLAITLNDKSRCDIVYFDFAKAFDSMSHNLILQKLNNCWSHIAPSSQLYLVKLKVIVQLKLQQ